MVLDKETFVVEYEPEWVKEHKMYSIRVTGLELRSQYRFHVWARTNTGRGDEMYVDGVTASGSSKYIKLSVSSESSRSLLLIIHGQRMKIQII
jgi:hypothetical protein